MARPDPTLTGRMSAAIGRSLDVYYRDAARVARMDLLNAQFVSKGGLAFDIGAHVGDRTGSFLRLGARVVALEPQPRVFRALRLIHGRAEAAALQCEAVGAEVGTVTMFVNTANPTISTASADLVAAAPTARGWHGQVWDRQITVPVTTLDRLIAVHGRPDFVKIDVEGHEHEVLLGLSAALPMLSFEFTTLQRDVALACVARLGNLGRYEFNLSLGEDHKLRHQIWLQPDAIVQDLENLPNTANSGDVYARLL